MLLVLPACSGRITAHESLLSTEATVYAAALDSLFANPSRAAKRRFILNDSTANYRREKLIPEFWDAFHAASNGDSALVRSFESAVRNRRSLLDHLDLLRQRSRWHIDVANDTILARISARADSLRRADPKYPQFADGYWREFYSLFPDAFGSTSVSAVGFDRSRSSALVYIEHGCGGLCGSGRVVFLQKRNGKWRVVTILTTWVS